MTHVAVDLVRDDRGGVTVMVDGYPQSYVDPTDPGLLAFEYIAHMASVVDTLPSGHLAVTHVGGGGLTLARYVEHARPGSPQIVLEPDAELTAAVRRDLPLPRGHRVRVRPVDGARGIRDLRDGSADVLVLDAYAGGRVPAELVTTAFLGQTARVLRPEGVLLANIADEPGLRYVARVTAGVREWFGEVVLLATRDVLKGRRFGNAVLAASRAPLDVSALARRAAAAPFPTGVWSGAEVRRRLGGARPLSVEDDMPSPRAPDPGRWRVR